MNAQKSIVFSVKLDPDKVASWKELPSIQRFQSLHGLLVSLEVDVGRARIVIVILIKCRRLFYLDLLDDTVIRKQIHHLLLFKLSWKFLNIQVREAWACLRRIPFSRDSTSS